MFGVACVGVFLFCVVFLVMCVCVVLRFFLCSGCYALCFCDLYVLVCLVLCDGVLYFLFCVGVCVCVCCCVVLSWCFCLFPLFLVFGVL